MAAVVLPQSDLSGNGHKQRTCRDCGVTNATVRWYPNITTHCAECWKARVREHRAQNVEYYRAFDKARSMLPHRVEARELYRQTEAGKAAVCRAHRTYHARNPEKRRAHIAVGNAVRDGKLVKPTCCDRCHVECSAKRSLHAHHHDYAKPLEVEWLCGTCHRVEHRP